jgi:hypothetical protein
VDIPLMGSRLWPRLNLAKVDAKPLVAEAIRKLGGGLLPGLLGPKNDSTSAPASQPSYQQMILDLLKRSD